MRRAEARIIGAIKQYASSRNWTPPDYRAFYRINERTGRVHVFIVARDFPGSKTEEKWSGVREALERALGPDSGVSDSIHLSLRTFEEFDQGGIYSPSSDFEEIFSD